MFGKACKGRPRQALVCPGARKDHAGMDPNHSKTKHPTSVDGGVSSTSSMSAPAPAKPSGTVPGKSYAEAAAGAGAGSQSVPNVEKDGLSKRQAELETVINTLPDESLDGRSDNAARHCQGQAARPSPAHPLHRLKTPCQAPCQGRARRRAPVEKGPRRAIRRDTQHARHQGCKWFMLNQSLKSGDGSCQAHPDRSDGSNVC